MREQYSSPVTKPEVSPPLLGEADAVLTRALTGNDNNTQTATAARTRATEWTNSLLTFYLLNNLLQCFYLNLLMPLFLDTNRGHGREDLLTGPVYGEF